MYVRGGVGGMTRRFIVAHTMQIDSDWDVIDKAFVPSYSGSEVTVSHLYTKLKG